MTAEEFKRLFLPLRHILFRSAFRISGTTQDAEDILQEVWLKLWQKRDTIPKDGNLTGFCVTLTRNLSVDFMRRQHLKTVDDEPAEHDAVQERSAQDEMEGNETRSSLMRIIDSEEGKETFKLYRESIAYKANHHETFTNTKDSAGYVFNG